MSIASTPTDAPVSPFDVTLEDPDHPGPAMAHIPGMDYLDFVIQSGRGVPTGTIFVDEGLSLVVHPQDGALLGFQLQKFRQLAKAYEETREERNRGTSPSLLDLIECAFADGPKTTDRYNQYQRAKKLAASYIVHLDVWRDVIRA